MFSPAYNSQILPTATAATVEGGGIKNINTDNGDGCDSSDNQPRDISSAEQRQQLQLCVFCRLRDPSRTLDQVSNNFLQQWQ